MSNRPKLGRMKRSNINTGQLIVQNHKSEIEYTNYWDSSYARKGILYITLNAGTCRMLVPDNKIGIIKEFETAREAIVSRGPSSKFGRSDMLEILFEDDTDTPYMLHTGTEQWDRVPTADDQHRVGELPRWNFSVWTRKGKVFEFPSRYRLANQVPYMKSWGL
jgi:hypothetical protein